DDKRKERLKAQEEIILDYKEPEKTKLDVRHQIHHLRTHSYLLMTQQAQAQVIQLAKRLGISRPVQLKVHPLVTEPLTIGFWKPIILFPVGLVSGLSSAQLEAILLHEIAHIQRADFLINQLQIFIEVLFFYHPAVWWISREIQLEREKCCDDLVLRVAGDPLVYAQTLTRLERFRQSPNPMFTMQATGKPSHLGIRIRRLFEPVPQKRVPMRGMLAILFMISLGFSPFFSRNQASAMESPAPLPILDTEEPTFTPKPEAPATFPEATTLISRADLSSTVAPTPDVPTVSRSLSPLTNRISIFPLQTQEQLENLTVLQPTIPVDSPIKPIFRYEYETEKLKFKIKKNGKEVDDQDTRYFVDGVEVLKKDLKTALKTTKVYRMEILNCEDSAAEYGVEEGQRIMAFFTTGEKGETKVKLKAKKKDKDKPIKIEKQKDKDQSVIHIRQERDKNPIIIIDGERSTKDRLKKISPKKIESIEVFKGEAAMQRYGAEGKDGVVVISLKGSDQNLKFSQPINLRTYPNPSIDRQTMISFQLEEASEVKIDVVDL
ncbi:MAG: M56 family metallopeptidase, partial [Bacteroidota bacterium]